jgi:hypothetical protein
MPTFAGEFAPGGGFLSLQTQFALVPTESGLEAFEFVEASLSPLKIIVEFNVFALSADTGVKLEFCFFSDSDVWIFC